MTLPYSNAINNVYKNVIFNNDKSLIVSGNVIEPEDILKVSYSKDKYIHSDDYYFKIIIGLNSINPIELFYEKEDEAKDVFLKLNKLSV